MPAYIIKPKPDEDFYIRYSTIVDSPTSWGSRAELQRIEPYATDERFARADEHGMSAQWGEPPAYGWHEPTLDVREGIDDPTMPEGAWWGSIPRDSIRAFCETIQADGRFHPPAGMVTWMLPEQES